MLKHKSTKFANSSIYIVICKHINQKEIIMSDVATKVQAIIVDKLGVDASEVTNEASITNE